MRNWERLNYSDTFKDMVDKFNTNSNNSTFMDSMTGTILCNGVLFNGNETVEGKMVRPLTKVDLSGTVNSDTIFDNFELYYRDTNQVKYLDRFPVDLLSYADGIIHFLYIKQDLTYRVSDYMFGAADEILLVRFVINIDSTWNQMYIMAQRVGTPMYNAADEFYDVDGLYVKSPKSTYLSLTSGTIKRSGIDFTDKISPDLKQFYFLASEPKMIRYINNKNEIDYTKDRLHEIITDKYMVYNMNKQKKIKSEEQVQVIQNLYYGIENYSNAVASELHEAIVVGGDINDLTPIVNMYTDYIDLIYKEVDKLYNMLGDSSLSSVRRAGLLQNKTTVNNYMNKYLKGTAISTTITETQVTAIKNMPAYIEEINLSVCSDPLSMELSNILDELSAIVFDVGSIGSVPTGKFTIQRILYDVYEDSFIVQYGDKIYDTFLQAIDNTDVLDYPAPYGKTIYIPLAIMIIKSGTTSIVDDPECLIIDRRWVEVDQENPGYEDYVSRAQSNKALNQIQDIINGVTPVGKANSLKCTVSGSATYKDGDYFLNYDNLNNKITVIDNITSSSYNSKQALSAYQGKVLKDLIDNSNTDLTSKINNNYKTLNNKFNNYLPLVGGTMTGTINSMNLVPKSNDSYNLGSSSNYFNNAYIKNINISGDINKNNVGKYIYGNNSVYQVRAMANSSFNWNNISNGTLVFCW